MVIKATTHLNFRGTARQALDFYQSVFGGHVFVSTYGDVGMPKDLPGADKVVFGQVENEDGFRLMAYDIPGRDDATSLPPRAPPAVRTAPPSRTGPSSSRSAERISTRSGSTGTHCRMAPRSSSRSPRRPGVLASACSPTASVSRGCSTWNLPESTESERAHGLFSTSSLRRWHAR